MMGYLQCFDTVGWVPGRVSGNLFMKNDFLEFFNIHWLHFTDGMNKFVTLWCGGGGVNIFSSRPCSDTVCLASGLQKLDQLSLNDLF